MVAELPDIAPLHVQLGIRRQQGEDVRVDEAGTDEAVLVGQVGQRRGQGVVGGRDEREEFREPARVRARQRTERIEGGQDEALLVLADVDVDDRDRRLTPRERLLDAGVAVEDPAGPHAADHALDPAHLAKHAADGRALGRRVAPPVRRVGDELGGWEQGLADDPVPPGQGSPIGAGGGPRPVG